MNVKKIIYMKKYLIFLSSVGLLAMGGCKKYLDVNTNPNTATVTSAQFVFANAVKVTADLQVGGVHALGSGWAGFWGHSTSFTGGGQEKTYVFTNNDFNFYDGMYDNLTDYQYVIDHAVADGFPHLVGPAKIMEAFQYQRLVDLYGDVPYSEALQGTAHKFPKFDNAQTIYESLITKLTEAISDINAATFPSNEPADIAFNGNKTNWIKLANTIKLRILMRQSNMPGRDAYITGAISAISGGFLTSNAYINPGYTKTSGKLNPFYATYGYDQNDAQVQNFAYRKMNRVVINWLKANDIFRLQRIACDTVHVAGQGDPNAFVSTNPNDYAGVPFGAPTGYLESQVSAIGSEQIKLGDATRPHVLISAAESYFLQAEAAERYGLLGTASTLYATGVQNAFRLAAATHTGSKSADDATADAAATAYLAQPVLYVNYATATTQADRLRSIWIQKWVALCNFDGLEAWSEYRRTNVADAAGNVTNTGSVPSSPHSVAVGGPEPRRLYYPLREESVNTQNVPQGINVFTTKIFWDAN
jgi:hypothetical protein